MARTPTSTTTTRSSRSHRPEPASSPNGVLGHIGRVIQFPVQQGAALANDALSGGGTAIRRLTDQPAGQVDDWGRDAGMFRALTVASQLRWDVSTGGDQHLPKRKGALIVINTRRFSFAHVFAAFAISRSVDRPVRFVGRPDDSAVGSLAQRLGGLLDDPAEVLGALRAGELVVISAEPTTRPRDVGTIDHALVGAALAAKVPVVPAATTSSPFSRHARLEIGSPVTSRGRRRGPLAELELADDVRAKLRLMLAEMGDINTGTPLDWLPWSGMGGN